MDVYLLWVLCVVRSLRPIDHSSRGVLPTVVRCCVWSRNLENDEAKARYRAVENTTIMDCNARKTNKRIYKRRKQSPVWVREGFPLVSKQIRK
jgi:hypothetical protein